MKKLLQCMALGLGLALLGTANAEPPNDKPVNFELDVQPLDKALKSFALQADVQVVFYSEISAGITAPRVHGTFTKEAALQQLLANTQLQFQFINDRKTVAIRERAPATAADEANKTLSTTMDEKSRTAHIAMVADASEEATEAKASAAEKQTAEEVDEKNSDTLVVTGTQIRGMKPIGSPLMIFSQEDFLEAGASTLQDFIAKLPQNFGGGQSGYGLNSTYGYTSAAPLSPLVVDQSDGTGVNLRGLGEGTTLVLLNGRRLAPNMGAYVDVSMIPLSSVERIEVLTDSGSAQYGSDAVGGVINIIMRDSYQGGQTQLRAGTTTQGGGQEYKVAQSIGMGWNSGNALLSYEHFRQAPIRMNQREFLMQPSNVATTNLTGEQKQDSAFLSASQSLSDRLTIAGDALYSTRSSENNFVDSSLGNEFVFRTSDSRQLEAHLEVGYDLSDSWHLELVGASGKRSTFYSGGNGTAGINYGGTNAYRVKSIDSKASGDLLQIPSGTIKVALGAGHRTEEFSGKSYGNFYSFVEKGGNRKRTSKNAFAEIVVPILDGSPEHLTDPRLAVSLSGRYEDDNQFGDTIDPKIGARWVISKPIQLRGSYGTSFKAPTLSQTDYIQSVSLEYLQDQQYAGDEYPGFRKTIQLTNPSSMLQPQTSKNWTAGLDINMEVGAGLGVHLTYFDIRYQDRIESIPSNQILLIYDPAFASVRLIRGEVPDAEFDAQVIAIQNNPEGKLISCAGYYVPATNSCAEPASHFSAITTTGLANIAATRDTGVDLLVDQKISLNGGMLYMDLNVAYLSHYTRKLTSSDPGIELVNTVFYPRRWNIRGSAGWSRGAFGALGTINFGSRYDNTTTIPAGEIPSLTTFDLNLRYETGQRFQREWLKDTRIILDVINAFDRDPPIFPSPLGYGTYVYDAANFNPYGRRISLTFLKGW